MSDPAFASARAVWRSRHRRELSSRELLDHFVARRASERAAERGGHARRRARTRVRGRGRRARARGDIGPLHGLPSPSGHVGDRGHPQHVGAPQYATHVPKADAVVAVRRLVDGRDVRQDQHADARRRRADVQTTSSASRTTRGIRRTRRADRLAERRDRGRDRHDVVRARQRHRRLDPHAVQLERRLRAQDELRHRADAGHRAGTGRAVAARPLASLVRSRARVRTSTCCSTSRGDRSRGGRASGWRLRCRRRVGRACASTGRSMARRRVVTRSTPR